MRFLESTKEINKHKETRFWGENIAGLVKDKRRKYQKQYKTGLAIDKEAYRVAKGLVKKAITKSKIEEQYKFIDDLHLNYRRGRMFKVKNQLIRLNKDVIRSGGIKNADGKVVCEEEGMKKIWKDYYDKLLNEEFHWDRDSLTEQPMVSGPAEFFSEEEVRRAIMKSGNGKASGPSGVVAEMMKGSRKPGVKRMTDICNQVVREGRIPDDWKRSWMVNVYKGKGDALECGSYRGIKLLEQPLKVLESVVEKRLRERVRINDMQFGFTPGRGTT